MYAEFTITHAMIWNLRFINMCLLGIYMQTTNLFAYARTNTDMHANTHTRRHSTYTYSVLILIFILILTHSLILRQTYSQTRKQAREGRLA